MSGLSSSSDSSNPKEQKNEKDSDVGGLSVTFRSVAVRVHDIGTDFGETIASFLHPRKLESIFHHRAASKRYILHDVNGQVRPGEMLLVLGRPGSGCSTLLKIIANQRDSFEAVEGDVKYGNMSFEEAKAFRDLIVFNSEEDIHFPTLTVSETTEFATAMKVPIKNAKRKERKDHILRIEDSILEDLEISHTKGTLVGNEFVRGVSGGERKRVSIAEVLATQAPVQCWDNSTRGLDASTAANFAQVLRRHADNQRKSIIATFYQAGNAIFNTFDKTLVLVEGRVIYYGPVSQARGYFEDMGFVYTRGANIADFLTAVAVPLERKIKPGFEGKVPTTAEEFESCYKNSSIYTEQMALMAEKQSNQTNKEMAIFEKNGAKDGKLKKRNIYTLPLYMQILICTKRQFLILKGDMWSNVLKLVSALVMSLVTGSLFYNLSDTSASTFLRPGALFFPILFMCMNAMSETTASFQGRPIIFRQKTFGFYHPAAHCFAATLADLPAVFVLTSLFEIVFYFMVGFQMNGGKFFTNWAILLVTCLAFISFYRMVGAWCTHFGLASQISGFTTIIMMVYSGYLIPFSSMHVWFRWLAWINPAYYALEAVGASEFQGLELKCLEPQLIPYGSSYGSSDTYKGCTVKGYDPSTGLISGAAYASDSYGWKHTHVWRNFGIICGFWVFLACMTAIGFEKSKDMGAASRVLFSRSVKHKKEDVESGIGRRQSGGDGGAVTKLAKQAVFTWKNIDYFVNYHGSEKQLLQSVSGFVKPGQLVALMGTSGAGKTTLMDVISQRKDSGRIQGSILVDGRPQNITFQRTTGYCEQNDVHESTATVREALIFSAKLRQPYEVPDQEKEDYVDAIMDMLELSEIRDALVGIPGAGLSIEQRKRLTLGVELVAKPSLLFLDEPTSGLDGQSAFNVVRFMRKLAEAGQAIVCTIHQPSASLFEAFDVLLLLSKGGNTCYFGETGKDSATLLDYFSRNGAPCHESENPADHIIEVVQGRDGSGRDWVQTWKDSPEKETMLAQIDELNAEAQHHKHDAEAEANLKSFATPKFYQWKLVTLRQTIALWRNPEYIWNKMFLHIFASLFGGFTFWMIGDDSFDLQLRLFSIFNFVFVAPGVINQLQPLFLHNRDIFEAREKKSKIYHWLAFIGAQLVSEIPYLIICGTIYFCCWYFTCGFPVKASISGAVYFQMLLYELLYTAIGQAIAAYAPNEYFAALANPIILGAALINFCGVVVPYDSMQVFWRYWMYYIDPFTYLVGGLLEPVSWSQKVTCKQSELTTIPIPGGTTCGDYMADFLSSSAGYVVDGNSTSSCEYCEYSTGADYMKTFNINASYYGWRDIGITALFCFSTYGLVFLMMKLRTKNTKTAS